MLLSKQSLIFLPVLVLWYEYFKGRVHFSAPFYITAGISLVIITLFTFVYAIPYSKTAIIGPGEFFLSQMGNLIVLIKFYFLPFQTALVHDLYFYTGFDASVLFGLAVSIGLIYLAFRYRKKMFGFLLGAFLIAVFPTNSFMPKNDIINEWRLYPTLVFFCILFVFVLNNLFNRRQKLYYILFSCYLVTMSYSVIRQNNTYNDNVKIWKQVVAKYPDSSDSVNNLGRAYAINREFNMALESFLKAKQMDPTNYIYYRNLAQVYSDMGNMERASFYQKETKKVGALYNSRSQSLLVK
jgi:tetratricopeptide (TPR) repeat protein